MRAAATFLARSGPSSPQDRWEENAGLNPFTLAVEVAALVAAVEFVDADEDAYLLSLADYWNERIEDWTFVSGGPLADGGEGYYVRLAPTAEGPLVGRVDIRNRVGLSLEPAALVGLEFMYLARLGLRRADDPKLKATLAVVERVLRVDTPAGPAYHRYNEDGYGEHEDGGPFDGTGIGRAWPLLTGERGHFELLLGGDPMPYLEAMTAMTGPGGLLPEQVWDTAPIPGRFLVPGKPTGSAMPLVWAHAELLKLLTAAKRGEPLELLDAVRSRYNFQRPAGRHLALARLRPLQGDAHRSRPPRGARPSLHPPPRLRRLAGGPGRALDTAALRPARRPPGAGRARRPPQRPAGPAPRRDGRAHRRGRGDRARGMRVGPATSRSG